MASKRKKPDPVAALARNIKRRAIYEDRLEYSNGDLQLAYGLNEEDAARLQLLLHSDEPNFKPF